MNTLPVPVSSATATSGAAHSAPPTARTRTARDARGRSVCSASSGMTGGGPSPAVPPCPAVRTVCGAYLPSSQPTSPDTTTTAGNGTPNTVSARNAATARASRAREASARLPTRTTAWATMASTAGARPANSARTAVVVPKATYTADSASSATTPGSTNSVPAARPPRVPLSSQPR